MYKYRRVWKALSALLAVGLLLPNVAWAAGLPPAPLARMHEPESVSSQNPFNQPSAANAAPSDPNTPAVARPDDVAERLGLDTNQPAAPTGRLLFAPAIDVDGDPGTNPAESTAVPVIDLFGHLGGIVTLAAQLEADDPNLAPIRIPVTFHIWSEAGYEYKETVESDAWGAVSVEVPLVDVHAEYAYQASAPGYGQTEIRYFRFDQTETSVKVHNGGAELSYEMGSNRWVVFTVTSPVPLDAERGDQATLNIMRRPLPDTLDEIEAELSYYLPDARTAAEEVGLLPMPTVMLEIVDSHTARAEVQLPAGDYGVVASLAVNGDLIEYFNSDAKRFQITDRIRLPRPTQAVWIADLEYEPGKTMVLYEGKPGRARFDLVDSTQLPPLKDDWDGQTQLVNVWRTGPFEWHEETYDVAVETRVTDGKKVVTLQNFDYDPIAQHYKLAIKSLHETVITDTLTIEVLGPGGVILQQEVSQVVLHPNQTLYHTVEVPADLGRPEGIRVTLADPLVEDLRAIASALERLYQAVSADGFVRGFINGFVEIFQNRLIEVKFQAPPAQLEVKTDFLDELLRDPWNAILRLAEGALDGFQMFRISWRDVIAVVRGDWDAINRILRNLSIDLGGAGVEIGGELGVNFTADFGDCPDDADVKALEDRLKEIAYSLDQQLAGDAINQPFPLDQFRVPLYGPLALSGMVIRLRIGSEIEAQGLTVTMSGQMSLGFEARVVISFDFNLISIIKDALAKFNPNDPRLKTVGWFVAAEVFRRAVNIVLKWSDYYRILNDVMNIQIPNGNCDPDPPDPRPPDDRQDVWQGVESFYQGGTHEDTISNLNGLIERAQAQNLDRAERFLTLRLRQAESARFMDDTDKYLDYMSDSFDILLASDLAVLDILSGTVPLSPTQTLTDAVTSQLLQAQSQLDNHAYTTEQQQIQDALAVAQRRYDELVGQELELQRELRQLFTADVVGVLASGFAESTLSALEAMGIPSQLISPWPGTGNFRGKPAAYVPPPLAPRALVVPSGGLHAIANSVGARDWLDAYVEGGGLLIVFSQAFGSDWSALPGGAMAGVGYEEDQRWQHATVEAGQPSDWLVWMGINRPDIQIDGAFTAWPDNANILLRRTFGQFAGSPVMVEYPYGAGTVLATTAYGDWAWQTNFWWGDDARLTHSVLIRAYLLSRGQDVADVAAADPASTVAVSFPLRNTSTFTATAVRLEIPLVWGTGAGSSVANVSVDLGPGQTGTVNASLPTPPVRRGVHDWTQVGLYRLQLAVTTKDGSRYNTWGPFVYVRSPIVPPAVAGSLQVSQNPASLFSTVVVTANLRNYTSVDRTVVISDQVELSGGPVSVTVPANSTAEYTYTLFMDTSKNPAVGFYDADGDFIGRATTVVGIAYPQLKATPLVPAALGDGSVIPVVVTNNAQQGRALAATLALSLTAPSGAVVWSDSLALPPIAAGQTITPSFTLSSAADELGTYHLNYRVDDGRNLARNSYVPLPSRLALSTSFDRPFYRIRENGVLTLQINNSGQFDLTPQVTVDAPAVGLSSSQSVALPVAGSETLPYNFTVPDTLTAGTHPVVVAYIVGGQEVTRSLAIVVPPAAIRPSLAVDSYTAGDTINVTLNNQGGVDGPLATTLQLIDRQGQIIAEATDTPLVAAGSAETISLVIPAGAAGGEYQLVLDGEITPTQVPFALYETIDVAGVAAGLTVQTGQPTYFNDEDIEAQASLAVTAGSLDNGNLNLRVCSPTDPLSDAVPGGGGSSSFHHSYEASNATFDWIDISATGFIVAQGDDSYSLVNLGFPFEFYGTTYTQAYIASNGYLTFGSGNSYYSNSDIPNPSDPNNAIYALWTDLYPVGGAYGNVYAQQIDASRYVVQWNNVSHCCSTGIPETFQVILDGSDHTITLQYLDVTEPTWATIGVENSNGSLATRLSAGNDDPQPTLLVVEELGVVEDEAAFRLTPIMEEVVLPAANFKSYLYTVGDVIFFAYEDGSELALYRPDGAPIWQGTLDAGQRQLINVPTGTYLATGSTKFAILSGDPVSQGVAGYYATDQNGFGVSRELYTYTQSSFFSPREFFIVFGYEDNTHFTVADATTGQVYYTGTLNNGQHWESNTLHNRWLHVTADKPVSAYTYYDQGSLIPAADGRWSGTLFYAYAGLVGNWANDVNIMAFEDNTQVTLQNLDTGQVYWTGTLNSGQMRSEPFGGSTSRGAAYLSVSSDKPVAVTVAPFVSFTGNYHMGFYAPDATGARIGTDLIAPVISGGTLQIFAYHNDTVVQLYNSTTGQLINTYTLQAGESTNAAPGYGLWRLRTNKPVSAWAGWGEASAEFAPVRFGDIVVNTPFDANCGYVLWEEDVPVTTAATFDTTEIVGALNVTGRLVLDGRLFANTGQLLAHDDYDFYLFDRETALTLETDQEAYRPGETVQISGVVQNTSDLTQDLTLTVNANGSPIYSQPLTLAPDESFNYTTSTTATQPLTLTATAANASVVAFPVVADPAVGAELIAPALAGRDPFSVTLVINNSGVVPATVEPTLAGQSRPSLTLQPGEQAVVAQSLRISEDTLVTAHVGGDADIDLSALVEQGELADLSLAGPSAEVAGLVELPFTIEGTGQLPATGELVVELDGAVVATQPFAAPAGDTIAGTVALNLPAGPVTISGRLVDESGDLLDEDAVDAALLAAGEAALPAVQVTNVTVTPSPVSAGDTVNVTVELVNNGPAGPIVVGLQLFGAEQQWIVTPDAFDTSSFTFELAVPGDVPADEYFGQLTADGQSQPFTVQVVGIDVTMSLALDKTHYFPGEVAQLTVTLTDQAGVSGDYIIMPRYLVAEAYDPITIGANQTVQYTFNFTVTEAARVNVFLATAGAPPDYERRVLMLDSLPVPVVQPANGAYLTFDKLVYDPGDTIHMEAHIPGMKSNVTVMGPMELAFQNDGFLIWAPPTSDNFGLVVTGTYPLSYTLPAVIREGRYTFVLRIDGQSYSFPVDVNGWKVTTRHMTLDRPRYAQQDELTAVVEFWNEGDTTIEDLLLTGWVFTPDGSEVLQLSPLVSRTVDLPPGLNVFTVSGAFDSPVVGPHKLLVNLSVPGTGWRVAGASAQFDVGWAHLVELTPDRGSYGLGEAGTARLDVYGYGPTHLVVTATGGQTVLDTQADLAGYETFTFAIPTDNVGDYLLIAQSTDQNGATDELIRPYNVPAPADLTPPQISLTYPNTVTVLTSDAPTMTITVLGQATDESGSVQVSVNGQVVTPAADGSFSAPLVLRQGFNAVSAAAIDDEGNIAYANSVAVYLLPNRTVTLAGSPAQASVGGSIVFQFTLTSAADATGVQATQLLPSSLITNVSVITETGDAVLVPVPEGVQVIWRGDVPAGTPVVVTVSGSAVAPGTLYQSVDVSWGFTFKQTSNEVVIQISDEEPPEVCSLYPIALHQSTLDGVPVGTIIPNIFNGSGPGNFGWLTWTGDNSVPALIASLTIPGNSHTYINPYNPNDHTISINDWVEGRPGVANAKAVRDALNVLKTVDIVVPVWGAAEGQGANLNYQVVAFARVRLIDYQLPGANKISAKFLGYVNCAGS